MRVLWERQSHGTARIATGSSAIRSKVGLGAVDDRTNRASSTRKRLQRGRGLHEVAWDRSVRAQLTEIANQLSVPIVGLRGTVRPLRDWNQEHGHAFSGVGGSDNRRPWQVRAPSLCLS